MRCPAGDGSSASHNPRPLPFLPSLLALFFFFFLGILFLFCISEKCFPYARLYLGLWGRK